MDRTKTIIKTSILGIAANIVLVIFKSVVGLVTGSVAVILDAVNNLSDALSSVITIIGTKLSTKAPDKKHPFGHGRVEYLTAMLISAIVLTAGAFSLKESIEKIIEGAKATYSIPSIIIIVGAIGVKLFMGFYVKGVGKKINASVLIASGADALSDAVLSLGTLVAAIISMIWGLSLEGWFGAVISIFILKAGIDILKDTLSSIIGTRADPELSEKLNKTICSFDKVEGCYDLTLHNYGPSNIIGSAHIQVPDDMTAKEIHKLTRNIVLAVYSEYGIILTIGVYASNTDETTKHIKEYIESIVSEQDEILQLHGFYVDEEQKSVTFDLVIDFKADSEAIKEKVISELKEKYPEYRYYVIIDSEYSDVN